MASSGWTAAPPGATALCRGRCDTKDVDRLGDVLDLARPEVLECERQLVTDLIVDGSGHADTAGFGHRLQAAPRC